MPTIRGNIIVLAKFYILEKFSQDLFQQVVKHASPATQEALSGVILSHKFYDMNIYEELLAGLRKEVSMEDFLGVSEYEAKKQLSGIYALLVKVLSVQTVLEKGADMLGKNIPEARLEILSNDPEHIGLAILDIQLPENVRITLERYMKTILEIASKRKLGTEHFIKSDNTVEFWFHAQQ